MDGACYDPRQLCASFFFCVSHTRWCYTEKLNPHLDADIKINRRPDQTERKHVHTLRPWCPYVLALEECNGHLSVNEKTITWFRHSGTGTWCFGETGKTSDVATVFA